MAKFIVNARQLRLNLAAMRGKAISLRQVAREIEEDHRKLMKLENNEYEDLPTPFLEKVAAYYHQQGVNVRGIVEIDPDQIQTPSLVPA
jgi:hypothetical protein